MRSSGRIRHNRDFPVTSGRIYFCPRWGRRPTLPGNEHERRDRCRECGSLVAHRRPGRTLSGLPAARGPGRGRTRLERDGRIGRTEPRTGRTGSPGDADGDPGARRGPSGLAARFRGCWRTVAAGATLFLRDALGRGPIRPAAIARRDRPRRHGCRDQGPRPGARPGPGRQGLAGIAPQQAGPDPPVHRGSPDRRPVAAPGHRADLRAGRVRRSASVLRHEAGERPHAVEPAR